MDRSASSNLNVHNLNNFGSSEVSIAGSVEPQISKFNNSQDAIQLQELLPGEQSPSPRTSKVKTAWKSSLERSRSGLTIFLRNVRLLALPVVGSWTRKVEKPKIAIHKSRFIALLGLAVHVIPLANALTLIILNFVTLYVGTDVATTALQFLAKFLELLTQASISNAFLVYLRHGLIGDGPLPFGALFAGLQITSVSYLWSLEFLGSVTSKHIRVPRKLLFVLLVTFNILLAAGVGPSIAIALIPRRQMYPAGMTYIWLNDTENAEWLFSSRMTSANIPSKCYERTIEVAEDYMCPYTGWQFLSEFSSNKNPGTGILRFKYLIGGLNLALSKIIDYTVIPEQRAAYTSDIMAGPSFTVPPMSMVWLTQVLQYLWNDGTQRPSKTLEQNYGVKSTTLAKQPIVWAYCVFTSWPVENVIHVPDIDYDYHRNRTLSSPDLDNLSPNSSSSQIVWIETGSSVHMSIAAVIFRPRTGILACPIMARWHNSAIILNSTSGETSAMTGDVTYLSDDSFSNTVKLTKEWAGLLLPTLNNGTVSVLDAIWDEYDSPGIPLASMITVALSHGGHSIESITRDAVIHREEESWPGPDYCPIWHPQPDGWADSWLTGKTHNIFNAKLPETEGKYRIANEYFVDGLAYTMEGFPKKFAIAILITYCIYITTFIIYILAFSGIQSSAWDSISEMTSLAMLSKPPKEKLRNTSAGIETVELFKEPVNIREVDNHLEIVFQNDKDGRAMGKVEFNKKY